MMMIRKMMMIYHGGEPVPRQRMTRKSPVKDQVLVCACVGICVFVCVPDDSDEDFDDVMCWGPLCPRPCGGPTAILPVKSIAITPSLALGGCAEQ